MWNASRFCVSSLRRGHANLLCIVPILVYVLPKQIRRVMRLRGWRYGAFVGGFFGLISVLCYTTMIRPMLNPEPYKRIRERAFSDKSI